MNKGNALATFKGIALRVRAWAEALLFPEGVVCLNCSRAPKEALCHGLCEACTAALEALSEKQERIELDQPKENGLLLVYVHAAFPYQDPARKLIRMFKYDHIRSAAEPLIAAMALLPSGEEELLVPIPTTAKRLKERGFNQ